MKVSITVQRALGPCGPSNMLGAQHGSLSTRAGQEELQEFRERILSRHKPPLAAPFLNYPVTLKKLDDADLGGFLVVKPGTAPILGTKLQYSHQSPFRPSRLGPRCRSCKSTGLGGGALRVAATFPLARGDDGNVMRAHALD